MRITKLLAQWKPGLRAVQLSCLALLSAGWSHRLQPPADFMSHEELTEQSRHLNGLYDAAIAENPDRITINLDLSDDTQYRFITRRLKAAGKNEKNSPELFSKLEQVRKRAFARKQARAQEPGGGTQSLDPIWCDHYLLTNPPAPSNGGESMTYEPYVRVSCEGGSNYVYADITAYDVNQDETNTRLVSSNSGEQYGDGTDFIDVSTRASVNVTEGRLLRLESTAIAIDDVTGRDVASYTVARTSIAMRQDGSFTLHHPREVVPHNNTAEVLMCQLRGGWDCDYAVAGYDSGGNLVPYPPNPTGIAASTEHTPGLLSTSDYWAFSQPYNHSRLYMPIRVDITAGARNYLQCTVDHYTYAKVKLHTGNANCANSVDFVNLLPVGSHSATFNYLADVSYNINGDGSQNCTTDLVLHRSTAFSIMLIGKARCPKADGTFSLEPFTKTQTIDGNNLKTRRIFYRNSCMAEGTHVQLADGTLAPVEQVKVGDKVRNGAGNKVLTVTDVARGNEVQPFVHLRDSAGHELTLTEMHPVIKANGEVVAAKNLKAKDKVRTDKGAATLTSVTRMPVNGKQVFNLKLGTPEELAGAGELGRTLYAGGILVGDMSMQEELERPAQKPASVLARLPKAWHRDFKNAQMR